MKSPAKDVVRIGTGNIYSANPDHRNAYKVATDTGAASWSFSEGGTSVKEMLDVAEHNGYVGLYASDGFDDLRDANDCTMMLDGTREMKHFSMTQVCNDLGDSKVAHARTFSMLAYEDVPTGLTICHVGIHPNWVQGIDSAGSPIAREYVKSVKHLDTMVTFAKDMGWSPVVTGDLNLDKDTDKPFLTTYDVFKKHQMDVWTEHIDGVAYQRRRLELVEKRTISNKITKSDHPKWLVADLKRKSR